MMRPYRRLMSFLPHGAGVETAGRLGLDVLAMLVLVGWLYRRRLAAPEMPLVFTALNIGLFAAIVAIGGGDFPTGVGFGLFGLLSLVRLRSAAFTLRDVAYTFVALVLGLVNGLPGSALLSVVLLDVLLVAAIWLTDESRAGTTTRTMRLTLDAVHADLASARAAVVERIGVVPLSIAVSDVDYVRETTRVWVRYAVDEAYGSVPDDVAARESVGD